MRIDNFINECNALPSETSLEYQQVAPSFKFSNTGRRGTKYFSIPLKQVIEALEDIKTNLAIYSKYPRYVEADWRYLFSNYISNEITIALAGVQTFPMFSLLNKVVTISNKLDNYSDKDIQLSEDYLDTAIDYLTSQMPDDDVYLNLLQPQKINDENRLQTGRNIVYYGAPGTGKSYAIDQKTEEDFTVRTVFHPDTQYSDFIGSLKPVMANEKINYAFRPGSFTDAIILAVNNPSKECTLVVEEINRAAAAAAFGEIFQLLDRQPTRQSKYPINVSDPDWLAYLNSKTDNYFENEKLVIPSNLSIVATMNSSDQAVMPLDTAFKRRWEFEYLPIDYANAPQGTLPIPLESDDGEVEMYDVLWADFAKVVNNALALDHIPEDKLLGHRFLDDNELNENGESALKGKLLMYLWDDVLRHGQRSVIFADYIYNSDGEEVELTTYGQLIQTYNASRNVLRDSLASELIELTSAKAEAQ
ncbi:Type II restriction-modification system restriction subunit [Vibrio jasicida]|uniref:Type II restriction-modification system restriction subunit n=1 Tax=Vibrio jasicida TaxID=766224 RepID=A0AAU9QNK3_9VIBR|nr:Type II restriction-modification system restriction subunit [Vibrio jasicida]CAH1592410.1 Type II restriction-modification system restriction subunit [Vibrio jasicida]